MGKRLLKCVLKYQETWTYYKNKINQYRIYYKNKINQYRIYYKNKINYTVEFEIQWLIKFMN